MNSQERNFVSFDGTPIHYATFPSSHSAKSNVLIVHGAGEYGGRYTDFANYLAKNSYRVYVVDLRGYGQSGGKRAHVSKFTDYCRDIECLLRFIKKENNHPIYVLGHSMGGLVTVVGAARVFPQLIDGILLSSPCFALSLDIPRALEVAAKLLAWIHPTFRFKTRTIPELLTHDEQIIAEHKLDDKLERSMTAKLFYLLDKQMKGVPLLAKTIRMPCAVFQAGADHVVSTKVAKEFSQLLTLTQCAYTEYQSMYHEILQETNRKAVYEDMLRWLEARQRSS